MCFSAEADFVAAAAIAPVAIGTLTNLRTRGELLIGALPLLFAAHQLVEGFVWLGLEGEVSRALQDAATRIYLIFAHGVLPILVPVGLLLLEPSRRHRRWIWPFVAIGSALGSYSLYVTAFGDVGATAQSHAIVYATEIELALVVEGAYALVTCGPALASSRRYLRWFGVVNLGLLVGTGVLRSAAVVSLWCVTAALSSVLILIHFRHQRRLDSLAESRSWEHRVIAALGR